MTSMQMTRTSFLAPPITLEGPVEDYLQPQDLLPHSAPSADQDKIAPWLTSIPPTELDVEPVSSFIAICPAEKERKLCAPIELSFCGIGRGLTKGPCWGTDHGALSSFEWPCELPYLERLALFFSLGPLGGFCSPVGVVHHPAMSSSGRAHTARSRSSRKPMQCFDLFDISCYR